MSVTTAKTVVSNYHFPLKSIRIPSRNGCLLGKGQGKYNIRLKHQKIKKSSKKDDGDMSKGQRSQSEEAPMDQIWNNLSINMNYSTYICVYTYTCVCVYVYIYSLYTPFISHTHSLTHKIKINESNNK